jgi:3'(2'), 5'-bisphosphate nucleotidase
MTVDALWAELEKQLLQVFARYRSRIADLPVEVKADRTLLTEADIAVQQLIIDAIRACEPDAVIIAEEDEQTGIRHEVATAGGRVWVIDPIDGTAQFVHRERREFCSVVCRLEDWQPSAALVLAPELGANRAPLTITADARAGSVLLNGRPAPMPKAASADRWLSMTRSSGSPARPADATAEQAGYHVKTRTTSQTLDMVRTAVDLTGHTELAVQPFDLFLRRAQKVWDGLAGLCLGAAAGLRSCDEDGKPLPSGPDFLSAAEPAFASTVMGRPETVSWYLGNTHP